tara:strand:- start:721 stop:1776 length:1056 start_codon:yes stop_codon:yes gene_type:complete
MLQDRLSSSLEEFETNLGKLPSTILGRRIKIYSLLVLCLGYEKVHFDSNLREDPGETLLRLVNEATDTLSGLKKLLEVENIDSQPGKNKFLEENDQEEKHQNLFQVIWGKYNESEFQTYIERYHYRIKVNNLEKFIKDKNCIDFGCGNGAFCFALHDFGAKSVVGIDFGEENILYAKKIAEIRNVSDQVKFKHASVYDTGYPNENFDFAIQNGVFHHLNDPLKANREVYRILSKGGHFWSYVNGAGSMLSNLFDMAVRLTPDISSEEIFDTLTDLNIITGKKAFLTDAFKASYTYTTETEFHEELRSIGFGDFQRLTGGFPEDYDLDKVNSDPYGKIKFGEGNLRILSRKM